MTSEKKSPDKEKDGDRELELKPVWESTKPARRRSVKLESVVERQTRSVKQVR